MKLTSEVCRRKQIEVLKFSASTDESTELNFPKYWNINPGYLIGASKILLTPILYIVELSSANRGVHHLLVLYKIRLWKQKELKLLTHFIEKLNIEYISNESTKKLYKNLLSEKTFNNQRKMIYEKKPGKNINELHRSCKLNRKKTERKY